MRSRSAADLSADLAQSTGWVSCRPHSLTRRIKHDRRFFCSRQNTICSLARSRNNLSLPNEFESGDAAKFYFKRNLPERQSRIKANSLWKPHDCPSASKVVVSEVQTPLSNIMHLLSIILCMVEQWCKLFCKWSGRHIDGLVARTVPYHCTSTPPRL